MLWDKGPDSVYSRALKTQQEHAARYNYPMHILRRPIVKTCWNDTGECVSQNAHSLGGHWNKLIYLHSLLVQELSKPETERIQWLMWQDADTITLNPAIDLSIFLPPQALHPTLAAHIHLLVSNDFNGLNIGVFFIRVSEWSLKFLLACQAMSLADEDAHLGWNYEQDAVKYLLQHDDRFNHGQAVWQPKLWWNAYSIPEKKDVAKGDLNVHFPGIKEPAKTKTIEHWLEKLEKKAEWEIDPEKLDLLGEIDQFWNSYAKKDAEKNHPMEY